MSRCKRSVATSDEGSGSQQHENIDAASHLEHIFTMQRELLSLAAGPQPRIGTSLDARPHVRLTRLNMLCIGACEQGAFSWGELIPWPARHRPLVLHCCPAVQVAARNVSNRATVRAARGASRFNFCAALHTLEGRVPCFERSPIAGPGAPRCPIMFFLFVNGRGTEEGGGGYDASDRRDCGTQTGLRSGECMFARTIRSSAFLACTPSPWLAPTYTTACPCLHIFGHFPTHG